MITRFTIQNFKRLQNATLELGSAAVFIGPNNSGKTTALQALALWDIGWRRWAEKRDRSAAADRPGVTINRRDLFAIPVPSAKLLWADLHTQDSSRKTGEARTEKVYISLCAEGDHGGRPWRCALDFYYANEESFYCRLREGDDGKVPIGARQHAVVFLPPMSGLAEREYRKEQGEISVLIGEGQTAQVLRNLCWQLHSRADQGAWDTLCRHIQELFHIQLNTPVYIKERSELSLTYLEQSGVELDLSSAGRGCQQVMLLLSFLLANPGSVLLGDSVPVVYLGNNKPQEARDHFHGLREAKPDLVGFALFDRLDRELQSGSALIERMWAQREIENYLVTPESLRALVTSHLRTDDLLDQSERERSLEVLNACMDELVAALRVTRRPDPWGSEIKVTDEFLDPLFENYFQRMGTPQQIYKRDYHGLADGLPLQQIDPEVTLQLDALVAAVAAARPAP